eukprot:1177275-Prorocentrum_minimum.AAC.1
MTRQRASLRGSGAGVSAAVARRGGGHISSDRHLGARLFRQDAAVGPFSSRLLEPVPDPPTRPLAPLPTPRIARPTASLPCTLTPLARRRRW